MQNPNFNHSRTTSAPVPVQMQRGRYFHFALPQGWRVQENTNGICLTSPDGQASIMAVGLVGMLQPFTPDQFMLYILNMHNMGNVRVLNGRAIPPAPGCSSAGMFEIFYVCNGSPARGLVTCHIALGYNQCNGSFTLSAAAESVWDQYGAWLPDVATQIMPAGPHTYMASTVAANDRRATEEFGQRLHEYNDYVSALHQQTVNDRWASQDRQNFHFRENLGGVVTYYNPYENRTVEIPTQHAYYWVNRQGHVYGTDDPRDDPRVGSTEEWVEMERYRP